jgi:hypothetical protein
MTKWQRRRSRGDKEERRGRGSVEEREGTRGNERPRREGLEARASTGFDCDLKVQVQMVQVNVREVDDLTTASR